MRLYWLGHACFLLVASDGTRVVTDPFDEQVGYPVPGVRADLATVSHQHFDHNATRVLAGRPRVVTEPGEGRFGSVTVRGVATYHDAVQGRQRGPNTVFVITVDGVRVCHLGDLGHGLTPAQVAEIGPVDVLLVPVGGTFTIGPAEAHGVVEALRPALAVPMHYKTDVVTLPLAPVEEFTRRFPEVAHRDFLEVGADSLPPPTQVVVLALTPPHAV
ncbi:MAG: MBL fold metallo-hydrolase [Firmicutes bacterium]|nr:MBL fold metallo-hydrolase [Bacillota bacterium]